MVKQTLLPDYQDPRYKMTRMIEGNFRSRRCYPRHALVLIVPRLNQSPYSNESNKLILRILNVTRYELLKPKA